MHTPSSIWRTLLALLTLSKKKNIFKETDPNGKI